MKLDNESGRKVADAIDNRIRDIAKMVYKNAPNDKSEIAIVVSTNTANQTYKVIIKGKQYLAQAITSALPLSVGDQVLCLVLNGQYSQIFIIGTIAK